MWEDTLPHKKLEFAGKIEAFSFPIPMALTTIQNDVIANGIHEKCSKYGKSG